MNAISCLLVCLLATVCTGELTLSRVFSNVALTKPVDFQNDGFSDNLYVVQQNGPITIIPSGTTDTEGSTFIDLTSVTTCCGERGLLGLAFHPDYQTNRYFFTYRTSTVGGQLKTIVSRYTANADFKTASTSTELQIITYDQPYANHNGGQIRFGPDGYLYIGAGDGGSGGDPQSNGQNLNVLLAKILRLDIDNPSGGRNYGIPATNPFQGNNQRPEIFAYGVRNPWRWSFDSDNGDLWAGDVGQDTWEEVDIIGLGDNMGWRIMEGNHCFNPTTCTITGKLPVYDYPRTAGSSITGGFVYRGTGVPELSGKYVFGDYGSSEIYVMTFTKTGDTATSQGVENPFSPGAMSAFGIDRCNELHVLLYDKGEIHKFFGSGSSTCPTGSASSITVSALLVAALLLLL